MKLGETFRNRLQDAQAAGTVRYIEATVPYVVPEQEQEEGEEDA